MMDADAVIAMTLVELPGEYQPLLLTFQRGGAARQSGGLVAIGSDFGTTLYCDPADGRVLSVDDSGRLPTRFVNSSIAQLAACLSVYERAREALAAGSPGGDDVEVLRSRLTRADAVALADPEHWWSLIVEQVEAGLL